jgi:hypothetical protein
VSLLAVLARAPRLARITVQLGAYAVGGVGWFWLIQRLGAVLA